MAAESKRLETLPSWKALKEHVKEVEKLHLRDLLTGPDSEVRNNALMAEYGDITMDYSRQKVTLKTMDLLFDLAEETDVRGQIRAMASGEPINTTENRAVLHMALRAAPSDEYPLAATGENVVPGVHQTLEKIQNFVARVHSGKWKGATGKKLTDFVSIGIGGSYLGAEFVYQALRDHPSVDSQGRRLHFLANVDPGAVHRALDEFNPETTLVIVVSKTFTTAETMLNARTVKDWLTGKLGAAAAGKHIVAVSTKKDLCGAFGVDVENVFEFGDWVGGRYSVCSAVGVLPLALAFGFDPMTQFLAGARDMDRHFQESSPRENLPLLLGLLGIWNSSFLGHATRALLPYSEALARFPAHIQQVDMESNGKRVTKSGQALEFDAGEIGFGEPGTNGQHSFYQLVHQGRVVPADFIGFARAQRPIALRGEVVSNHDELMSNFFAQPDALALGKTRDELVADNVPPELIPHKVFPGDRPSTSLLFSELNPFTCGQLLALYEHRTAVQGFVWGINSFDQWGVELGKVLGKKVRLTLEAARKRGVKPKADEYNSSTMRLLKRFLAQSK